MSRWPWPPLLVHRCGGALAPENTLAGLRIAARLGCRAVEFDVMLSRDRVPVLIHDETLMRTAGIVGAVPELSAEQLQSLRTELEQIGFFGWLKSLFGMGDAPASAPVAAPAPAAAPAEAGTRSEPRRDKARVGMPVARRKRGTDKPFADPAEPLTKTVLTHQFEIEPECGNSCCIGFERGHIRFAPRQFERQRSGGQGRRGGEEVEEKWESHSRKRQRSTDRERVRPGERGGGHARVAPRQGESERWEWRTGGGGKACRSSLIL